MIYLITFLFALTQLGDWYTTEKVLAQGGHEVNPIMATIFKIIPYKIALPIKGIIATILVWYLTRYILGMFVDIVLFAGYCFVVVHNYLQLKQ